MNDFKDNPLALSWHDSAWIPHLNTTNIMDYFSERSNPFYDRTCNNELIKMQRLDPEQMNNMTGLEYILLHCQEPILFVIRKQIRHSPQQAMPQSDYYIIAGYVYQAPDLTSVINARLLTGIHHLISAFDETREYMRYHPTKGYSWKFTKESHNDKQKTKERDSELAKEKAKEEYCSTFQQRRVDMLLAELAKKFPPKLPQPPEQKSDDTTKVELKVEPSPLATINSNVNISQPTEPPLKKQRVV